MDNCFFCYQPVPDGQRYHNKCSKRFFGVDSVPELLLNTELLNQLAKETVNQRISITGVQPKLSVELTTVNKEKRLTVVGLWGKYILKPQNKEFLQMPEVEDLTMHLAALFKIKTCNHCLIPASNGEMVYLAERFDRQGNFKIHMEDFCQLGEFQTEQKYDSSYERCGKLINKYCTYNRLDILTYFEVLLFSFLSGNNDMHMKNFSVLHRENEIILSPAYDLINGSLINPADREEMALLLNGRKKNIKRRDFEQLANVLGISSVVFQRMLKKYTSNTKNIFELIDYSFLSEVYKKDYKRIWLERTEKLKA
ncbi:serine/threonine-protein kinase HipA [Pedobacter cryoconitis]|uniref:Serine/threonine-protein kinase HipA n=1 Tax=Pedobacter cryoconitis TaxID=188932 RepID=A0A7W8YYM5_9SPHI|nr:HipA domain-containing protein [Pedobacter cryoconitis]MBB5624062.1 serine/threonine-protein kinase HipA [Pedobacter cryoconitis]MBB5647296.1 serine/threonine-protein kinase HipA [Pedobacter cryoconitis]